jgi:hypothetical protein
MGQSKTPNCFIVIQQLTEGSTLVFIDFNPEVYIDLALAQARCDELNESRQAYCSYYYEVMDGELKQ